MPKCARDKTSSQCEIKQSLILIFTAYFMSGHLALAGLLCSKEFERMNVGEKEINPPMGSGFWSGPPHLPPPTKEKWRIFIKLIHAAE